MKYLTIIAALAFAAPAFSESHDSVTADTVLATVNGTDITLGHLISMRERLPAQFREMEDRPLYDGMLEQIIQQQILADSVQPDKATTLGLENESRALLAGRELTRLEQQPLDEAAVQAAYDSAFGTADGAPEYNASHILVETQEDAQAIVVELEGGADFAELARERSTGPTGPNGGQLGWFGAGQMVPPFEQAVVGMEVGEVSAPVETQFGWHVIKLNETRQTEVPTLEEARAGLEETMREASVLSKMESLTAAADVSRFEVDVDPAMIRDLDLLEE